ncbi:hypothetical protein DN069_10205 [Streptacidiphilus pinicola]|uniref:Ribbon-helix-helix protein CopG domain-containing protein n=1 Tax=Streptacidiphilus pinicola TaxID=2219663 RepID=A0A2X0IL72_9ACTN|nr:hypothetical protein [Streptacidiphilus pinicola]RAG85862.1 hypothetical protein DN069_10205 [Streptacidiphilus pinicola]
MSQSPEHPYSERYSVTLCPPAVTAVAELSTSGRVSKSDVINRAVLLLDFVEKERAKGRDLVIRDNESGALERIHII